MHILIAYKDAMRADPSIKRTKEEASALANNLLSQAKANPANFASLAMANTDDSGSKQTGGEYDNIQPNQMTKAFNDYVFNSPIGSIGVVETEFGYHIILVEKIKGQEVELRHILISPKVSSQAVKDAKAKIEGIRQKIINKEITFADAAKSSSDEKETRNNGGVLLNPRTMEPRFELTKMDPALYAQVSELKDGEVSMPILDQERGGGQFYKILTINNRFEEHQAEFSKDYIKIKELALRDKQIKEIAKWTEEKIKETYIKINDEYKDCEFTNNWLKK